MVNTETQRTDHLSHPEQQNHNYWVDEVYVAQETERN